MCPGIGRYADRSRSRLAKRKSAVAVVEKPKPQRSKLKVDAQKVEGAKKIETPKPAPKVEKPKT